MGRRFKLEQIQIIPKPRSEVFAFFADARNLERLTPDFLGFQILIPGPIEMKAGAIIDYSLRLYGVSLNWRTRIEAFEPESRFVDTQLKGLYRHWYHLHEFEEVEQGTRMRDVVDYELPFGPWAPWLERCSCVVRWSGFSVTDAGQSPRSSARRRAQFSVKFPARQRFILSPTTP